MKKEKERFREAERRDRYRSAPRFNEAFLEGGDDDINPEDTADLLRPSAGKSSVRKDEDYDYDHNEVVYDDDERRERKIEKAKAQVVQAAPAVTLKVKRGNRTLEESSDEDEEVEESPKKKIRRAIIDDDDEEDEE